MIELEQAQEQKRHVAQAAKPRWVETRSSSVRRSIGRRVIALGARIAAEPAFALARSR